MENKNNMAIDGVSLGTPVAGQGNIPTGPVSQQSPVQATPLPAPSPAPEIPQPVSTQRGSRLRRRYIIVAILFVVLLGIGVAAFLLNSRPSGESANQILDAEEIEKLYGPLNISLDDLAKSGGISLDGTPSLAVNGQLRANNAFIITPSAQPGTAVAGQIYFDSSSNQLRYYNGSEFTDLLGSGNAVESIGGASGAITLGGNLSLVNGTLTTTNDGVLSVQGQTGNVQFTSGGGIAVDGTTLTNTGVLSIGGASGNLSLGSGLAISGGTLRNSGVNSLTAGTPNLTVVDDGAGNLTISSVGGGTGTVNSPGGTAGRIAKFTGVQTIADSLLSESGATVTVNGNLSVTGTTTLSTPLAVASGGTGANSAAGARSNLGAAASGSNSDITALTGLTTAITVLQGGTGVTTLPANGVLLGNGTSPISSLVAGGPGLCLISNAGAPSWQACPGSGGVTSLNGQAGALTIANSSIAGSTITIDNASTSAKGIAQFNSTNFSVTTGNVNTIQNIDPTATPTFAGVNTNAITPSGALTVGTTSQSVTLQGSNTTITETNGANLMSLTFVAPTANVTYRLQTAAAGTYDVCTTAGNCVGLGGSVTTPGGTTNRIAKFTSSNAIGDSLLSDNGTLVTVNGDLTVTGVTTLSTPLAVTSGGTGANSASGARTNLGAAASGANSDITSLSGLTTALSVIQGGTGATSLTANGVLLGNGTSPISSLVAGSPGQCLVSTAGAPTWQTCPGSGGVTSINGETGIVTIANASASSGTITINDASTAQKGIAQFNATNFSASSGTINTIQDINTAATPTFGRLTLTSSQATNPMLLVNNTNAGGTGNLIDLQLNGSSRMSVSPAGAMTLTSTLNGQTISSSANFTGTLGVTGLASLNGGATVTGTLTANTITPTGALTVGATNQSFTLQGNASSTLTATSGANTTTVSFQAPTANVTYRLLTAAAGTYDICTTAGNCAGVGGGVTTAGGTTNRLAKFTGSQAIGDSIITDNGTTVTVGGTLAVNTITPSGAMTIGATGQNLTLQGASTSLSATDTGITNTLTFATPSGSNKTITIPNASGTVAVSATGPLQLSATGAISCPTCVTSGGGGGGVGAVDSLNGLTGALTIANASTAGTTITIDDASTSQKGIAQFNSTNFSVSGGIVNTIQDINTTAAPQFGRLTVTSSQASNDMMVVNNTNGAATGSLLKLQLNGGNRFTVDPAGNVVANGTLTSGAINGQTISSTASFTGTVAVAGLASLNGGATVTGTLTANTITPNSAMTVGATSQQFTLQGNASSTITATNASSTTSLAFQTPTANVTYRFLTTSAGTYDVCTTAGNCVGLGGGITGSGTTGTIAKFTASGAIGDSLLTESGSTVTVGGNLNLTSGNQFQINGSQISSANLSNDANLAKLNATQTFTGTTNTFQNGSDSTNSFSIQNAAGRSVLRANTTAGSITLGNITSTVGQGLAGTLVFADGTNDNFGLTLNTTTLTANRTISLPDEAGTICIRNSSACGFLTGSASDYIQNQNASDQTANFRISGTGRIGTELQAPLIDTATAVALDIGGAATAINLNENTAVTGAFTQSSGNFSSTSTGTSSLTAGGQITITAGGTSTWSTTSGDLTVRAPANNTLNLQTNGNGTVNVGVNSSNTINIGTGSNIVRTITIGNNSGGSQAQNVTIGDVGGSSSTTIQGGTGATAINLTTGTNGSINATTTGTGNINLNTASSVLAKSTTNSATAFQVQRSDSSTLFVADTSNARVYIGSTTGDTTGVVLVLDTKTDAGDPTGVDGAMYYSASTGRMRCYWDGKWRYCGDDPGLAYGFNLYDDFMMAMDEAQNLNWRQASGGTQAGIDGVASETNRLGIAELTTGNTTTGYNAIYQTGPNSVQPIIFTGGEEYETAVRFPTLSDGTNPYTARIGFCDQTTGAADCTDGVYFEYNHDVSANWQIVTANNSTHTRTATSTAVGTSWTRLKFVVNAAGTQIDFYVNGTNVGNITTNIPNTGARGTQPEYLIFKEGSGTAHCPLRIDYFQFRNSWTTAR